MIMLILCFSAVSCGNVLKQEENNVTEQTVVNKAINGSDEIITLPPELVITNSLHEISAIRCGYYWEHEDEKGETVGETCDAAHPLDCRELLPTFDIFYTTQSRISPEIAYLMFDICPDKVTVTKWNEDAAADEYDSGQAVEVSVTDDGYKYIELCDASLYEIYAEWDSKEKYRGNARYSFIANLVQPIIVSGVEQSLPFAD
ncbi:MAG: hypothetical protein IKV97_01340 [Clostridia bacterium]|nr:hypothetical protein [Clostridia bacterium]